MISRPHRTRLFLPVGGRRIQKEERYSNLVFSPSEVEFTDDRDREAVAFTYQSYGDAAQLEAWRHFSEVLPSRCLPEGVSRDEDLFVTVSMATKKIMSCI